MVIHKNMSLREALKEAQRLGCEVTHPRRTGEVVVSHPLFRVRVNCRRHDVSQRLVSELRRLAS